MAAEAKPDGHFRILLGTRNGARWLPVQLQSLLDQTHGDWSLWISDDGSDDDTRAVIDAFAAGHPGRVEAVLHGPRRGAAQNYLSLLCHPDLPPGPVALCDQDDVWLPGKLARAAAALQGEGPRAYAARYLTTAADLGDARPSGLWPRGPSFENAMVQNVMAGHTLALNAAALALVRAAGPREVPHHDWWLYLLLTAAGVRPVLDPEPVVLYRQHDANALGAHANGRAMLARARMLRDGRMRDWMAQNRAALQALRPMLTHEAQRCLDGYAALDGLQGAARVAGFRRLGLHRQSRRGTLLLLLAARLGQV